MVCQKCGHVNIDLHLNQGQFCGGCGLFAGGVTAPMVPSKPTSSGFGAPLASDSAINPLFGSTGDGPIRFARYWIAFWAVFQIALAILLVVAGEYDYNHFGDKTIYNVDATLRTALAFTLILAFSVSLKSKRALIVGSGLIILESLVSIFTNEPSISRILVHRQFSALVNLVRFFSQEAKIPFFNQHPAVPVLGLRLVAIFFLIRGTHRAIKRGQAL